MYVAEDLSVSSESEEENEHEVPEEDREIARGE
jgi:hypothetical protein